VRYAFYTWWSTTGYPELLAAETEFLVWYQQQAPIQ